MTPDAQLAEPAARTSIRRRGLVLGAVAAISLAAAIRFNGAGGSDDISPGESDRRQKTFLAAWPLHLAPVRPDDMDQAWQSLGLPDTGRTALATQVRLGRIRLAWLELFDSDAQDGDVVLVQSLGLQTTVPLRHEPTRIAVALPPSGLITVVGVDEGTSGGVTVGLMTGGRKLRLPPIRKGEPHPIQFVVP